jgi:hypothetical protein
MAGRTWRSINDAFGFVVAVHPRDAQTAWFVPAIKDELRYPADGKLAVTRTRDGGKSFETLRAACRRNTPTISSTVMAWTSTKAASSLRSAPPPAASGYR